VTPARNWTLVDIFRVSAGRCEKCHARLRWAFMLMQGDDMIAAGSECVKALTYKCDPNAALRALTSKWQSRRGYYYKRIHGEAWSVGRQRTTGRWWIGHGPSVRGKREFLPQVFATFTEAKAEAVRLAVSGGWA